MAFAALESERFAVESASQADAADRKATEDPRLSPGLVRPRGWPGGLRKNCHPGTGAQRTVSSSALRPGVGLPGLLWHSQATGVPGDAADGKVDRSAKRWSRRQQIVRSTQHYRFNFRAWQASTTLVGSMASESSCISTTLPLLSIT